MRIRSIIVVGGAAASVFVAPTAALAAPTCADTLGIEVHGQHVIADYVTGLHGDLAWPPAGQVGAATGGNGGAALPGGPGPAFHFANGFAPGASFCTNSKSPGVHL